MKSSRSTEGALSSSYLPVDFTNKKTNYFMFGSGSLLATCKVTIYPDRIVFGRSILKPGCVLYKKDIDTIELFRSVATLAAQNIRIFHHAPNIISPIVIQQYDKDLDALKRGKYPFKSA